MGLTVKNKTTIELTEDITNFFSLNLEETEKKTDYNELKQKIYLLEIDNEEKANILNKISQLETTKSSKDQRTLSSEIEKFKNTYNL